MAEKTVTKEEFQAICEELGVSNSSEVEKKKKEWWQHCRESNFTPAQFRQWLKKELKRLFFVYSILYGVPPVESRRP